MTEPTQLGLWYSRAQRVGKAHHQARWAEAKRLTGEHAHLVAPDYSICINGSCEDAIPYAAYQAEVAKPFGVPVSMVDGRPWVPTAAESDPVR